MPRRAFIATTLLGVATLAGVGIGVGIAGDAGLPQALLEGRYRAEGPGRLPITISRLTDNTYGLVGLDWEGVGFLDRTTYWGVFKARSVTAAADPGGATGTHRATLRPDGSLAVHVEYTRRGVGSFDEVWLPDRADPPPADTLAGLGEGVSVELPEAVKKVAPSYPEAARKAGVDGLILLSVLVGEDGLVKETRIRKSIPLLDEAAGACVRQWVFKPALSKGRPVAIWVAVPVRFTLN